MSVEKLKHEIELILGNSLKYNNEFTKSAKKLRTQKENLLDWCRSIKNGDIRAKRGSKLKKGYIFIKKLGSINRCIVIKVRNGKFVELHLGDHEYYDKLKKLIGL